MTISRAEAVGLGLKRYFTGTPCVSGHLSERRVVGGECIECGNRRSRFRSPVATEAKKARGRSWYRKNAEKDKPRASAYRRTHRERRQENNKRWLDQNPEKKSLYRKKQYDRNKKPEVKSRRSVWGKAWRKKYPNLVAGIADRYRNKHPDRVRESRIKGNALRRCRKWMAASSHSSADIDDIKMLQKNRCAYCKDEFTKLKKFTVDHIQPLSRGGSDGRRNLQLLCKQCNSAKWAHDPIDHARSIGLLI